jgi:hypothetical protein
LLAGWHQIAFCERVLRVQKIFHSKQHMDYSSNSCTVKITITPITQNHARPKQAKNQGLTST